MGASELVAFIVFMARVSRVGLVGFDGFVSRLSFFAARLAHPEQVDDVFDVTEPIVGANFAGPLLHGVSFELLRCTAPLADEVMVVAGA